MDGWYRAVFTDDNVELVDRLTVAAAIAGFVIHLGLLALARFWTDAPTIIAAFDGSFLSAIYTPFSFILFYEVFALVLSIPRSFTASVGVQLQIISLIVIRRIFGDIGHLGAAEQLTLEKKWVQLLGYDMIGALVLFFGVILFTKTSDYVPDRDEIQDVETFVKLKRAITLLLAILLAGTAIATLGEYAYSALLALREGSAIPLNHNVVFYREMFTVMIFTDVAILIVSLAYSHKFELVFRNAGFVIATILLRFSLSVHRPLDLLFIGAAFAFAIAILFGYGYYLRAEANRATEEGEEPDIV